MLGWVWEASKEEKTQESLSSCSMSMAQGEMLAARRRICKTFIAKAASELQRGQLGHYNVNETPISRNGRKFWRVPAPVL